MRRLLLLTALLVPGLAGGDVYFDGSMGPEGAAPTRSSAGFTTDYVVGYDQATSEPQRQGELRGANLFQSLDRMDLGPDERASFLALDTAGNPLLGIQRVITRVTSGNKTVLDGVLRSEIPGADFVLLNPAGIDFIRSDGDRFRLHLDVPAGFTTSTADYLVLDDPANPDGVVFDVSDLESFSLSTGAIESYGFAGDNRGRVTVDFSQLELQPGQRLQVVAGDVVVTNESIVHTPGGATEIAAVGAGVVEVPLDTASWKTRQGPSDTYGEIVVESFSEIVQLDSFAPELGRVVLRGGRLVVDDARVEAGGNGSPSPDNYALDLELADEIDVRNFSIVDTAGARAVGVGAGRISAAKIRVRDARTKVGALSTTGGGEFLVEADDVEVSDSAFLGSRAFFGQAGAPVRIDADTVTVRDGGEIGTEVSGTGAPGGKITILTDELLVQEGGRIFSSNVISSFGFEFAGGEGGALDISADRLVMSRGTQIEAFTGPEAGGGDVLIGADTLEMDTGAQIRTRTQGDQNAGDIRIIATESIEIRGDDKTTPAGIFARTGVVLEEALIAGTGNAGDIVVAAPTIGLTGAAVISARSFGEGNPGSIAVTAPEALRISGTEAGTAEISTRAQDGDSGGSITVTAGEVLLQDGGGISASTSGSSPGGLVQIAADTLGVRGERPGVSPDVAAILSESISESSDGGDAGLIDIDLGDSLRVEDNGAIRARTKGGGNAGSIDIHAGESVVIRGGGLVTATAVGNATGEAGNVEIDAPVIVLEGGAVTTEAAFGTATGAEDDPIGGNIDLTSADHMLIQQGSLVSASSFGSQDAGRVTLDAGRQLLVHDSKIATDASVDTESAAGGQIDVFATEKVELVRSEVSTSVRASAGNEDGGNVLIDPEFVIVNSSQILAQAQFGNGGRIDIFAGTYLESADSEVNASSLAGGIDGEVNVNAPDVQLKGELVKLPARFLDASSLLRQHCAAQVSGGGSFVVTGSEAPQTSPDRALPASMPLPGEPAPAVVVRANHDAGASDPSDSTYLRLAALDCEALARQLERQGALP